MVSLMVATMSVPSSEGLFLLWWDWPDYDWESLLDPDCKEECFCDQVKLFLDREEFFGQSEPEVFFKRVLLA
jgi:hypothetical protein